MMRVTPTSGIASTAAPPVPWWRRVFARGVPETRVDLHEVLARYVLDEATAAVVVRAFALAGERGHRLVGVPHLVSALKDAPTCAPLFDAIAAPLRVELSAAFVQATRGPPPVFLDVQAQRALARAALVASELERRVAPRALLRACWAEHPVLLRACDEAGVARNAPLWFAAHGVLSRPPLVPGGEDRTVLVVKNDDYTPMEVVMALFTRVLDLPAHIAQEMMLAIHEEGSAVVAEGDSVVVAQQAQRVAEAADQLDAPLWVELQAV